MFHLGAQNEHVHKSVRFSLPELDLSGGQTLSVALSEAAPPGNQDFQYCPELKESSVVMFYIILDLRTLL